MKEPAAKMDDLELEEESSCPWVCKFDPSKKKKKKTKTPLLDVGTDYGYEELLGRVFGMLREDHLEVSAETPRTVMPPPHLLAHTCLNFAHLCTTMRRKPEHVMRFLLCQMDTKGFLNKQHRLEIDGLVSSNDFQAVFRRYIDAFVICTCCKSPDTDLAEDKGLFTLRCAMCGLVASIKEPNPVNNS